MEFFRHCPSCGHRFHIKFESKQLIGVVDKEKMTTPTRVVGMRPVGSIQGFGVNPIPIIEPGEPIIVDVDEFQYNYKCKLCGHEWSELKMEKHVEKDQPLTE